MFAPRMARGRAQPTADVDHLPDGARLPSALQTKLLVDRHDDPLEDEADRIANTVLQTPADSPATPSAAPQIRRANAPSAAVDPVRASEPGGSKGEDEAPALVQEALQSPGHALDSRTRVAMESSIGHDFSQVRVHVDAAAADSARAIHARAYTLGRDVVFGPGAFAPHTIAGRRLLAHELVHVAQQGASPSRNRIQRFTEPGHKLIGDAAFGTDLLQLGGVKMSYGDAVALGDYFGSFDYVRRLAAKPGKGRDTHGVLRYVIWVKIRKHKKETKLNDWYDESAVFQAEQISRNQDSRNTSHFPNPQVGDTALDPLQKNQRVGPGKTPFGAAATYRDAHEQAMRIAYDNGVHQRSNDDALLADGFACHFLTDSFSASHLRTPRASIKEYWDQKVPGFRKKLIEWLAFKINQQPLSSVGLINLAERGLAPVVAGSTVHGAAITQLSIMLSGGDFSFGDVVSLIVHDAEGARGVSATIDGKPITLVGDKDLVDEKPVDDLDPDGDKVYSLKQAGAAAETSKAAIAAVRASLEDIYDAYFAGLPENLGTVGLGYAGFGDLSRTSHHQDFASMRKKVLGKRGLFRAEQLIPTAVDDKKLSPEKQALPWQKASVDEFLRDRRIRNALVAFGKGEAQEFRDRLKDMKDLKQEHRRALEIALIEPLESGNADRIAAMFLSILHGPYSDLQIGPRGVEPRQPGSSSHFRVTIPALHKRFDL